MWLHYIGNVKIAEQLIDSYLNINAGDKYKRTPLHYVCGVESSGERNGKFDFDLKKSFY